MGIITTTRLVDEMYEEMYAKERSFLDAEREEWERRMMLEISRGEKFAGQPAKVRLGKVRKRSKFEKYATVSRKLPRIIKNI